MYLKNIIVIGASAGGPRILKQLFTNLPCLNAAVILVQHMPDFINQSLADSLNHVTYMHVKIAEDKETLQPGIIYIAPSDVHLVVVGNLIISLQDGDKVCFVRPSVDVTMRSLKPDNIINLYGVVLTGMGRDGADGLCYLKANGARTIAQDEATSIIYGMPKEAVKLGCADLQLAPDAIREQLIDWIGVLKS